MRCLLAMLGLVAIAAGPATAACDPGEVEIRFNHAEPAAGNAVGEGAQSLAALVDWQLDGRACMTVTAEAPGLAAATVTEGLSAGDFDIGAVATGNLGRISRRYLVFDLPFLFDDIQSVLAFQYSDTGRGLLAEAQGEGLTGLDFWLDGFQQIGATRPVRSPADLSGLRIVASGSEVGRAALAAMEAEPVSGELDAARLLAEDAAEGQAASWSAMLSSGAHRELSALTETNHGVTQYVLMTSTEFWEELDPALRADLAQLIAEISHERNRLAFELNEAAKYRMESRGVALLTLSEAERLAFKRAMQEVWFGFGGEIGFDQISAALHANRFN